MTRTEAIESARAYFGESPKDSFAWGMVVNVFRKRFKLELDPNDDEDILMAFEYVAGGCGVAG